jgi:predicted RNA-binding Zn ribbon-like protein
MPQTAPRAGHPPEIGVAPGQLETVRGFVNTLDMEEGTDELSTPAGLRSWLGSSEVTAAEIRQAIALREALRGVLRSHLSPGSYAARADGPSAIAAPDHELAGPVAGLRRIVSSLRTRLEISDDGKVAAAPAGTGPAAALARILLIAAEAGATGTWTRLKVCGADDCQWAFYDRSPTRSGCWCSMRICGARAKSRAYRQRAAAGQAGGQDHPGGSRPA